MIEYGNNPNGALDINENPIRFKGEDVCCSSCNYKYVIPGRQITMHKQTRGNDYKREDILRFLVKGEDK